MQGAGRVFYTSMGHREDVISGPIWAKVVTAGIKWATGVTHYTPKANVQTLCPDARYAPDPKPAQ
jgi:type 1 glutamine amidotransferase